MIHAPWLSEWARCTEYMVATVSYDNLILPLVIDRTGMVAAALSGRPGWYELDRAYEVAEQLYMLHGDKKLLTA